MSVIRSSAMFTLPLDRAASEAVPPSLSDTEREVTRLFDESRTSIFRYVLSFGLLAEDGEEITQEAFLALFRHLNLGKSRQNLRGWLFSVAHNLALKRCHINRRSRYDTDFHRPDAESRFDPGLNPEEQVLCAQRHIRLQGRASGTSRAGSMLPSPSRRRALLSGNRSRAWHLFGSRIAIADKVTEAP